MSHENTHSIALTCSFITMGMSEANWRKEGCSSDIYGSWGQGGVELHAELVDYAIFNDLLYDALNKHFDNSGAPGVWEYEVSEPFGKWFGEQVLAGKTPTQKEGRHEMTKIACLFWHGRDKDKSASATLRLIGDVTAAMNAPQEVLEASEPTTQQVLEDRVEAAVNELTELRNALFTIRAATDADRKEQQQEHYAGTKRMNVLCDQLDKLASRVRCCEERYEGFLVGLNENVTLRVREAVSAHMENVTGYIDKRVDRQVRAAFGKAHDAV